MSRRSESTVSAPASRSVASSLRPEATAMTRTPLARAFHVGRGVADRYGGRGRRTGALQAVADEFGAHIVVLPEGSDVPLDVLVEPEDGELDLGDGPDVARHHGLPYVDGAQGRRRPSPAPVCAQPSSTGSPSAAPSSRPEPTSTASPAPEPVPNTQKRADQPLHRLAGNR